MPVKKEIIYPIFLQCCQFATDIFWESIFEDLAYGKLPYGTYISNNTLCCSYKDRHFSYKIENKDPLEIYKDIYVLFSKKLIILSHKDRIKKKIEFYNAGNELKNCYNTWSSIRKKNIQDLLIEKYVINMKTQHQLSLKQARYLLSVIYISRILKVISSKDIQYENGCITSIDGITYNNKKIILENDMYSSDDLVNCVVIEKPFLSDLWQKYIETLKKLN